MFAKIFTLATLVAAVAAIPAAPAPLSPPAAAPAPTVNTCNVGTLQCCESLQAANSQSVQQLAQGNALLAAALGIAPVTVPVGLTCSPLSIAALGGNSCSAQPVCCEDNRFNGVAAVGCTPANIGL